MKICLIKPPILHKGASFALMPTPPLGLAYIASALKENGYELQVIDATAEGLDHIEKFKEGIFVFGLNKEKITQRIDTDVDIICFSFMFTNNWMYGRELIAEVGKSFPKATIIAGGEHVNAAPDYCLKQAPELDFIVFGEGEETIVELVGAIANKTDTSLLEGIAYKNENHIVSNYKRKRKKDIEDIAWPAWELFPIRKYFDNRMSHGVYRGKTLPVMASRGCPYACTFCSSPQMWGRKYQVRPPSDFVDELEYLNKTYGAVNFDLFDLTAIIYKDWIIEMCKEIEKRGLDITYQLPSGTRSEAIDFEVATHLYNSGCKNITYAPESGSKSVLKAVKKKVKIKSMLDSIKYSSKAGMNIHLNMIIGFPDDTHKNIFETLWFLIKCSWYGANDVAIAVFTPYPGSELYDRLTQEGKLNIYDDKCVEEIIDSYDLWPSKVYSNHISAFWIKFYVFMLLISFYLSNYIFRPIRLFITLRNLIQNKHESRLEQILYKNFIKNALNVFTFSRYSKSRDTSKSAS